MEIGLWRGPPSPEGLWPGARREQVGRAIPVGASLQQPRPPVPRQVGRDDLAMFDNRAVLHTATYGYDEVRVCYWVVATGEAPALDSKSVSRSAHVMISVCEELFLV